jgi:hypothetical protein
VGEQHAPVQIGKEGTQSAAYVAGITVPTGTLAPLYVDASGQLGAGPPLPSAS